MNNKKEQTIDRGKNTDKYENSYDEWKKPEKRRYKQYGYIYIRF
jgi:hypothetical protein